MTKEITPEMETFAKTLHAEVSKLLEPWLRSVVTRALGNIKEWGEIDIKDLTNTIGTERGRIFNMFDNDEKFYAHLVELILVTSISAVLLHVKGVQEST